MKKNNEWQDGPQPIPSDSPLPSEIERKIGDTAEHRKEKLKEIQKKYGVSPEIAERILEESRG